MAWKTTEATRPSRPAPLPLCTQDFALRPAPAQQSAAAPPSLIRDDESCRLWHKTDGQFRKPKMIVEIRLVNPVQYASPESVVSCLCTSHVLSWLFLVARCAAVFSVASCTTSKKSELLFW